jgi:hypothetical protein
MFMLFMIVIIIVLVILVVMPLTWLLSVVFVTVVSHRGWDEHLSLSCSLAFL